MRLGRRLQHLPQPLGAGRRVADDRQPALAGGRPQRGQHAAAISSWPRCMPLDFHGVPQHSDGEPCRAGQGARRPLAERGERGGDARAAVRGRRTSCRCRPRRTPRRRVRRPGRCAGVAAARAGRGPQRAPASGADHLAAQPGRRPATGARQPVRRRRAPTDAARVGARPVRGAGHRPRARPDAGSLGAQPLDQVAGVDQHRAGGLAHAVDRAGVDAVVARSRPRARRPAPCRPRPRPRPSRGAARCAAAAWW